MNSITKVAHTPGAIRAAWQMTPELDVREMAEIIDRETAAPEMLEALDHALEYFSKMANGTIAPSLIRQLEVAIQKARGAQ